MTAYHFVRIIFYFIALRKLIPHISS